ncbi:hypothetical protein GGU11DRAFT_693844 [Lentinula aff. detonsa]|nr:hypothetical protein GGU11DRAFT_693844 [Lentinula aff. detonsa]
MPSLVDPKDINAASVRAVLSAQRLQDVLDKALDSLVRLYAGSLDSLDPQLLLGNAEASLAYVQKSIGSVSRAAATDTIEKAKKSMATLEKTIDQLRKVYPDTTAVKIDNSKYFINLTSGYHVATLIAFCIVLASRVFQGAARRGAGALLKGIKLFGYNLTLLAGGPNDLQKLALLTIPDSIPAVETKFNLDVEAIPQAMCTKCGYVYPPTYPNGLSNPEWPERCSYRLTKLSDPCGESLLKSNHQPQKTLEYYPFPDWFGRFLSLPGIEKYGDWFSNDIAQHYGLAPATKCNVKDGSFFHSFTAQDDKLFIADRGEEGRWFFLLHADFFNVEGNRLRGKTRSTGIVSLACLNLPLQMRNDSAHRYIPYIIPGPYEPDAKVAAHQHILHPMLSDIVMGYQRGFRPHGSHGSHQSVQPYARVHRTAVAMASMDSKAARPFAGLLDVISHHHCFICRCFHKFHMGRTDFENWVPADDDFLRRGAEMWRDAKDDKERIQISDFYGTRYSALWMLGNWKPSKQLLVEPMHIVFLVILQRFFQDALKLDNPDSKNKKGKGKGKGKGEGKGKGIGKDKRIESAADGESEDELPDVPAIHQHLSRVAPTSEQEMKALKKRISGHKWLALVYVCNNLNQFPVGKRGGFLSVIPRDKQLTIAAMADTLVHWRMSKPLTPLRRADIDSVDTLNHIQLSAREVITPSWITKPPFMLGTKRAGTLKAAHWHSPIATANADDMASVLDTAMQLVCASIVMTKDSLQPSQRDLYRNCLRRHVDGLKKNFPGFILPSHHLAFHIYDGMDSFSTVRNWWAFPYENLIGRLQRIPTNHKTGELEQTLLHSFYKGANFRQWLLRPDCPDELKEMRDILERAYGYNKGARGDDQEIDDVDNDGDNDDSVTVLLETGHRRESSSDKMISTPPPLELTCAVGRSDVKCFLQVAAPRGFFNTPTAIAKGNSYIAYKPDGDSRGDWAAGQIHHIFQLNGRKKLAIRRSIGVLRPDPFSRYRRLGFDAKLLSSSFSDELEIIDIEWAIGHAARWEFFEGLAAVVNLARVRVLDSD